MLTFFSQKQKKDRIPEKSTDSNECSTDVITPTATSSARGEANTTIFSSIGKLGEEDVAEWTKWQAGICCKCLQGQWISSPNLNRVAAPFALSMTLAMLQNAAVGNTFKVLEEFTNLGLHDEQKLLKCFSAITAEVLPESRILKPNRLNARETKVLPVKNLCAYFAFRLLVSSDIEMAAVFRKFLSNTFHHEPELLSFENPRQCSVQVMKELSDAVGLDLLTAFAKARRINPTKSDTGMPIPRLCTRETKLMAICATRLDALWVADLAQNKRAVELFLVASGLTQKHIFFGLKTKVRTCSYNMLQAVEIPIALMSNAKATNGKPAAQDLNLDISLLLIRPQFAGELSRLLRLMDASVLLDILKLIDKEELEDATILLPCMELASKTSRCMPLDLCGLWNNGLADFSRLSATPGSPRLEHLFHYASIRMDEQGISFAKDLSNEEKGANEHMNVEKCKLSAGRHAFNYRFDSPFIFLVVEKSTRTALLSGRYAGCPPLPLEKLSSSAPNKFSAWLKRTRKHCCGCFGCC